MQSKPRKLAANYGISREATAYAVTLTRKTKRTRKAFGFDEHGGIRAALRAARAWRDDFIAANPMQYRRDISQRPRRDSKGVPGVFCQRDSTGKPKLWRAHTQIYPGKILQKSFSVGRYGRQARKMAIAERARQLEQVELRILTGLLRGDAAEKLHRHRGLPEPIRLEIDPDLPSPALVPPEVAHKRNKTGCSGVTCVVSKTDGQPLAWVARTRAKGSYLRTVFQVELHGDAEAKRLAIAERERQLQIALSVAKTSRTKLQSR
ncbi:hypothetical protein [uncultured Variovorax sp.]|uniref:hypothetical protein n=1 Tax=uncultured Variovorax sp. TaxID=114708 RepID=UPI00260B1D18|nr:hypothetical protein [uncultured Variovorax sp.]